MAKSEWYLMGNLKFSCDAKIVSWKYDNLTIVSQHSYHISFHIEKCFHFKENQYQKVV